MNKRKIALILVVLLSAACLFAAEVSVTWQWEKNDPAVNYFRYQLDGEEPEGWTVVKADINSYTVDSLEGTKVYTLYLQQSYDGEYWSTSATAASQPLVPEKSEFADAEVIEEQPKAVAPVVEPVVEQPIEEATVEPVVEAVVEEPATEVVAPVKKPSTFQFTTELSGGLGYGFKSDVKKSINFNLGLDAENIVKAGAIGFDIRSDIGLALSNKNGLKNYLTNPSTILKASSYNWAVTTDFQLGLNATAGKFMFYVDGGARLVMNLFGYDTVGAFATPNEKIALKWGVTADLGVRYNISKLFGVGIEASYTYLFDSLNRHMLDTRALIALTF